MNRQMERARARYKEVELPAELDFAVCLPHLCEQWQNEIRDKFASAANPPPSGAQRPFPSYLFRRKAGGNSRHAQHKKSRLMTLLYSTISAQT